MLDDADLLSALEPEQLAAARQLPIPRRQLKRWEIALLWFLRAYVLFMVAVVIYQAATGSR